MRFFEHQRDARGQTRRLLLWFALTLGLLVLAVNAALALGWGLSGGFWMGGPPRFPRYFFEVNTGVTLMFVLGGWWLETSRLREGGAVRLAEHMGARMAYPSQGLDEQRLCNVVDELAISSGLPRPAAMVVARDASINAFATGWEPSDAVIAVTRGALEQLTREELQGLVAHEFSHIGEGDTRLNMRLAGMVFGLEMLFRMGQDMVDTGFRQRPWLMVVLGGCLMAAGWLGWLAGHGLQAAVSRQREYLADARAVQWTRSRDGLGGVLRKCLAQQADGVTSLPMGSHVQHMLLIGNEPGQTAHWLDSHPTLPQRIRRIYGRPMGPLRASPQASAPQDPTAATAPSTIQAPDWTLQ